jgi:hypothetical protein
LKIFIAVCLCEPIHHRKHGVGMAASTGLLGHYFVKDTDLSVHVAELLAELLSTSDRAALTS